MSKLQIVFFILVGYLAAAPLTDKVSLDVTLTEWTNILTYFWIVASVFIWFTIAGVIGLFITWVRSI